MITMTTLDDVLTTYALPALKHAQKQFNKEPNAQNWTDCLKAMMVYQQLKYALRRSSVDREKLMFDLEHNPLGAWPDVICRATIGMTCADAIK
jgi:hypothetical protein